MGQSKPKSQVERWNIFQLALQGPQPENPFKEVRLSARFEHANRSVEVKGFYDGGGTYKIRLMPEEEGEWEYVTRSNVGELDGKSGIFTCTAPFAENHGPVRVDKKYHFSYADGTPFFVLGTTAYAWTYRPEEIRTKSLNSFSRYGFNKIRMLFFPKHYGDGKYIDVSYDPPVLPFRGKNNAFDFSYFNVEYFRNYEQRVKDLRDRNIQAEVILFHFYDFGQWGIDVGMSREDDLFFLDYFIARLAAYRNVWWSLANEYDLLVDPNTGEPHVVLDRKDWNCIGRFIQRHDPYNHLRSVHNVSFGIIFRNQNWLTHISYQHPNTYSLLMELKRIYGKPVINDEYQYEGNVPTDWGNTSPELELCRHWQAVMAGGYATHGEAYRIDDNSRDIFWCYGGELVGGSPSRLKFMERIVESCPFQDMEPGLTKSEGRDMFCLKKGSELYLYFKTPNYKDSGRLFLGPPEGIDREYEVEIYDAWNCWLHKKVIVKPGMNVFDLPKWAAIKVILRR